ncbi:DDE-type integrase/transposase/recombinase [Sneathiella sp. P13V-1]|uniref:Mu transposase C-terminal domain-containing protein n=1 Tax=Sneathiella sp. P13V-1 TaxID=2697366 RepID=UPI00187B6949|nr:Mu transposase C-terminal domain-containing protein [Sneathiella sp. P13V-1]MBE7635717.1 DDE-type integrase/transposase/recombinase [Sneathiella sp. P13V-1]
MVQPLSFEVSVGNYYRCDGVLGRVMSFVEHNVVLVKFDPIKDLVRYKIHDLEPLQFPENTFRLKDITSLTEKEQEIIDFRFNAIKDLLDNRQKGNGFEKVKSRAQELNVSYTTLYRWIKKYKSGRSKSALLDVTRSDKGKSRIDLQVEELMQDIIDNHYLTPERPTIESSYNYLKVKCDELNLKPPHKNTLLNRIRQLPDQQIRSARFGKKAKRVFYAPSPEGYQEAIRPLSVIQIDHTLMNIVCVDEEFGEVIGRPWITLAIDVYSRMVAGFFISFDPPSAGSVAQCIYHAVQPKDEWLKSMGIEADWPVYGLLETIHCDNAREFRGNTLKNACEQYNMNLQFRPVAKPEFGAHIERLMGTLSTQLNSMKGTTRSNVTSKGDYDPAKNATYTISQVQKHCTIFFSKIYHTKEHTGLDFGYCPLLKYKDALHPYNDSGLTGTPPLIVDQHKFRLDFMPMFERTIQKDGVSLDTLTYYSDTLEPFIKYRKSENSKASEKFIFRRDPWDISKLYFKNPITEEYSEILCKDTRFPPMSLWEFKAVSNYLSRQNLNRIDTQQIIEGHRELQELANEAQKTQKQKKLAKPFMRKPGHHDPTPAQKKQVCEEVDDWRSQIDPSEITAFTDED